MYLDVNMLPDFGNSFLQNKIPLLKQEASKWISFQPFLLQLIPIIEAIDAVILFLQEDRHASSCNNGRFQKVSVCVSIGEPKFFRFPKKEPSLSDSVTCEIH